MKVIHSQLLTWRKKKEPQMGADDRR